jgi:integrase
MVRTYEKAGRWMVEIRFRWPEDRSLYRERIRAPVASKMPRPTLGCRTGSELLLRAGKPSQTKEVAKEQPVPTLAEFRTRYLENYARANRNKASTLEAKESIFKRHRVPKLDRVNNVVSEFYEFPDYDRLVEAAEKVDTATHVAILLGGDARLRRGEICAPRWCDVDFVRKQIRVEQSDWKGAVGTPKGGRGRVVPMTDALDAALKAHRHLRGERVLTLDDGKPVPGHTLRDWIERAQRRAGLPAWQRSHPSSHVLLAPGHAGRARQVDPGAGRTHGPDHHATLPASVAIGARECHRASQRAGARTGQGPPRSQKTLSRSNPRFRPPPPAQMTRCAPQPSSR